MKVFGKPTLKDLYELSKDPTISVSSTPFGADLGKGERQLYIKKAVPWKGVKGIENLRRVNPKVADTVAKLADASRRLAGIRGTVHVVMPDGRITAMPKKALMQMAAKDPGVLDRVVGEYIRPESLPVDEYVAKVTALARA